MVWKVPGEGLFVDDRMIQVRRCTNFFVSKKPLPGFVTGHSKSYLPSLWTVYLRLRTSEAVFFNF